MNFVAKRRPVLKSLQTAFARGTIRHVFYEFWHGATFGATFKAKILKFRKCFKMIPDGIKHVPVNYGSSNRKFKGRQNFVYCYRRN